MNAGPVPCGTCKAAADAAEALEAEQRRHTNVLHYLRNVPRSTPLADVYQDVTAIYTEPEPGRR